MIFKIYSESGAIANIIYNSIVFYHCYYKEQTNCDWNNSFMIVRKKTPLNKLTLLSADWYDVNVKRKLTHKPVEKRKFFSYWTYDYYSFFFLKRSRNLLISKW